MPSFFCCEQANTFPNYAKSHSGNSMKRTLSSSRYDKNKNRKKTVERQSLTLLCYTGLAGPIWAAVRKQNKPNGVSPRTLGRSVASVHWNPPWVHMRLGWAG